METPYDLVIILISTLSFRLLTEWVSWTLGHLRKM